MNDTSLEMRIMQVDLVRAMPSDKRIALACEMYMAARELILESLSSENLSENERITELYRRLYREELPADFFRQRRRSE